MIMYTQDACTDMSRYLGKYSFTNEGHYKNVVPPIFSWAL